MPENNIELAGNTNIKTSQVDKSVDTPADFTSPEVLYNKLIETIRQYHPSSDLSDIERAYKVAKEAHEGQFRKSGEPYIIHPLCVAIILAELELDKESIIAGLLHDVVEDTVMTSEDVAREFGDEVALLVDGVTKLTQLNYQHDKIEVQAENLRKMFLAMAKDIRVIMIKLADRLHNMRTMQYQSPAKQVEKSRETMDIYAPIAHRLGISKIKVELDDLSMKYLMPDTYNDLVKQVDINRPGREAFIKSIIKEVGMHISNAGIEAEIDGRVKHFFSIYRKMVNQNKTLDQIYDIFAGKGITETTANHGNKKNMEKVFELQKKDFNGLCYINLVDFDMIYGHRRDILGYTTALNEFDKELEIFLANMRGDDVLFITADHGCDPGYKGTDHTRESVPLLGYSKCWKQGVNIGTRDTYADIAATLAQIFEIEYHGDGTGFLEMLK